MNREEYQEDRQRILDTSREELFSACRSAASTSAKLDLFLDFFWKCTMNDFDHMKDDIQDLKKFMWKVIGVFAGVIFGLDLLFRYVIKIPM